MIDPCEMALRSMREKWPPGTELVVVEVHDGGVRGICDLVAYPMDRTNNQVAGDHQLLARDCQVPVSDDLEFNDGEAIAEHVARCWMEVGVAFELPAFVTPHDHWRSYDVRRQLWVNDSEIYHA